MQKFNRLVREVAPGCASIWAGVTPAVEEGKGPGRFFDVIPELSVWRDNFCHLCLQNKRSYLPVTSAGDSHYQMDFPSL